MSMSQSELIAAIVRDAGGEIVGRTRLQKTAYLLDVAGYSDGFRFVYKHYGPFSHNVAEAAGVGSLLGDLVEDERPTAWGGTYSVYTVCASTDVDVPEGRKQLAIKAAKADAIALELAATAVFLSGEGYTDPWSETARRKPEKVTGGRLEKAKLLLSQLRQIDVPNPLPDIA